MGPDETSEGERKGPRMEPRGTSSRMRWGWRVARLRTRTKNYGEIRIVAGTDSAER